MTNLEIVEKTSKILMDNTDWREAYERYANGINKNEEQHCNASKFIKKKLPKNIGLLRIYSCINLVQKKTVEYDLRIYGQSVGSLKIQLNKSNTPTKAFIKITPVQEKNNLEHLNLKTKANPKRKPYEWESKEAQEIISSFVKYNGKDANMHSNEHKLETLVLHDLAKKQTKDGKALTYIQPVKLGNIGFFQMRTPLSASRHTPDYPKYAMRTDGAAIGGGIDILARIMHKDNQWRLAIVELKDENNSKEPQHIVMQQALVYSTFIAHLLRDKKCGNKWYNIFRNQEKEAVLDEKKTIDIDVITMMPPRIIGKSDTNVEGELNPISVPDINVTLHPATIYIDTDPNISEINSISGSLLETKKL